MTKQNPPPTPGDDDGQVVHPPRLLRAKVVSVPDGDPDAHFAAVDKAIAGRAATFLANARVELRAMRAALHEAATTTAKRDGALDRIYTIAHDLKGQGSSYGYPMVTRIGGLLCHFLRARPANDAQGLRIAAAHVDALAIVLAHRIAGDGGTLGASVLDRLEKLVVVAEGQGAP